MLHEVKFPRSIILTHVRFLFRTRRARFSSCTDKEKLRYFSHADVAGTPILKKIFFAKTFLRLPHLVPLSTAQLVLNIHFAFWGTVPHHAKTKSQSKNDGLTKCPPFCAKQACKKFRSKLLKLSPTCAEPAWVEVNFLGFLGSIILTRALFSFCARRARFFFTGTGKEKNLDIFPTIYISEIQTRWRQSKYGRILNSGPQ